MNAMLTRHRIAAISVWNDIPRILSLLFLVITMATEGSAQFTYTTYGVDWTAYNDAAWHQDSSIFSGQGVEAGASNYSTNSPWALNSGALVSDTGSGLPIQVAFSGNPSGLGMLARDFTLPGTGTDLDALFTGKVGPNNAINWTNGTVVMTLSGLNPTSLYTISIWSSRGATTTAYSNRWTDIVISNVISFSNTSSTGLLKYQTSVSNDSVRVVSVIGGGRIAKFDSIQPGTNGTVIFTLTANGATPADRNGYLNAFMVRSENNPGVTITGYNGAGGILDIPSRINGIPVRGIADYLFYQVTNITSVLVPDSVTNIGQGAFFLMSGLTNVVLGTGAKLIPKYAFGQCTYLESITIPSGITSVGEQAFRGCGSLKTLVLPSTITNIGDFAISYCGVSNLFLSQNLNTIGVQAFEHDLDLPHVTIPDSVISMGNGLFFNCVGLTNVTIGNSATNIVEYMFKGCPNLATVNVGTGVTSIGDEAFYEGGQLTSIALPAGVLTIGRNAFHSCGALTNVTFGESLTTIGQSAFESCTALTSLYFPDSLVSIDSLAFYRCLALTNITFSANLTSVANVAFWYCTSLTRANFRGPPPSLGSSAFDSTPLLQVYYLPGITNWGTTFAGHPTAVWRPEIPNSAVFGVQSNLFGFDITWSRGMSVIVEASTNLASTNWIPLQTNTLVSDSTHFTDPQWTNHSDRFYRVRMP